MVPETQKKLTMGSLRELEHLLEETIIELRERYSPYDDPIGFPTLLQFLTYLEGLAASHPYYQAYLQRKRMIDEANKVGNPNIMFVSFAEAMARFKEALALGREAGPIDVEQRGAMRGDGGKTVTSLDNVSPEIYLIPWIVERIFKKNQNAIIAFTGLTGSGKSYSAIELALLLGKMKGFHFDPEIYIIFTIDELISLIYMGERRPPPGSIIIFDDAGVGANSRDWQDEYNKILAKIAQSFRFMNYVFLVTVPKMDFIDRQAREVVHARLTTVTDEKGTAMQGTLRIEIAYQDTDDVTIFMPPEVTTADLPDVGFTISGSVSIRTFHFEKIPDEVAHIYEGMKEEALVGSIKALKQMIDEAEQLKKDRLAAYSRNAQRQIELADDKDDLERQKLRTQRAELEARLEKAEAAKARGAAAEKKKQEYESITDKIMAMRDEGKTEAAIGKELGMTPQAVHMRIIRRRNLPIINPTVSAEADALAH